VYGLSQKEIASFLDIAPSTVEKHISRGMNVTAEYMCSAGYTNIISRSKRPAMNTIHGTREKEQTS
jgi:IS30 family transposase